MINILKHIYIYHSRVIIHEILYQAQEYKYISKHDIFCASKFHCWILWNDKYKTCPSKHVYRYKTPVGYASEVTENIMHSLVHKKIQHLIFHMFISDISFHFHLIRSVGYTIWLGSSLCETVVHQSTNRTSNQKGDNRCGDGRSSYNATSAQGFWCWTWRTCRCVRVACVHVSAWEPSGTTPGSHLH